MRPELIVLLKVHQGCAVNNNKKFFKNLPCVFQKKNFFFSGREGGVRAKTFIFARSITPDLPVAPRCGAVSANRIAGRYMKLSKYLNFPAFFSQSNVVQFIKKNMSKSE